jgi:hypothetical protein
MSCRPSCSLPSRLQAHMDTAPSPSQDETIQPCAAAGVRPQRPSAASCSCRLSSPSAAAPRRAATQCRAAALRLSVAASPSCTTRRSMHDWSAASGLEIDDCELRLAAMTDVVSSRRWKGNRCKVGVL